MTPPIAGVVPRESWTPRTRAEFAESVADLASSGRSFAFVGGGTELALGNAPRPIDVALRTVALDALVDYSPADQTITVEAGMTLAELDRILAEHGQMFPLDCPDRARATVGGVVAANASGRRRTRYGTAKDLIVGVELVRPDGVRARGGGVVVKNVAGFDLPKLAVGSLGTLGAVASASFRVYPIPAASGALAIRAAASSVLGTCVAALAEHRLEPESVVIYDFATLVVTFAGTADGVAAQTATLEAAARRAGAAEVSVLSELEREGFEQREAAVRRDGMWRLRIAAPPASPVAQFGAFFGASPLAVPVAYPTAGVALHAFADEDRDVAALRAHVAAQTGGAGTVVVTAMPDAARARVDAWGPPPPSFPLMRALKERFDPLGLCNPGRFVGGL